jgi:hypothetical protein
MTLCKKTGSMLLVTEPHRLLLLTVPFSVAVDTFRIRQEVLFVRRESNFQTSGMLLFGNMHVHMFTVYGRCKKEELS